MPAGPAPALCTPCLGPLPLLPTPQRTMSFREGSGPLSNSGHRADKQPFLQSSAWGPLLHHQWLCPPFCPRSWGQCTANAPSMTSVSNLTAVHKCSCAEPWAQRYPNSAGSDMPAVPWHHQKHPDFLPPEHGMEAKP
ncbi:hypothetical protein H8959_022763 [Pygathrix nigripes]